jgi:PPM family protein phosphatase
MFGRTDREDAADVRADEWGVPAAITDTGCERDLNEDRYAIIESASGLGWIVCDGMGGVRGGELAAQLVIDGMRRDLEGMPQRSTTTALRSAILEANRIIVLRRQNPDFAGMGTTIVCALFSGTEVALAHVGDSRAYLIHEGRITQLTKDHTFVQELVDSHQISADQALSHPQAHILTRALGSEPALEVGLQKYWIKAKHGDQPSSDILVLCTDGLYSHVNDREICAAVMDNPPRQACVKLVDLAKARGGFDNITLAVIPAGGEFSREAPEGMRAMKAPKKSKHQPAAGGGGISYFRLVPWILVFSIGSAIVAFLAVFLWLSLSE